MDYIDSRVKQVAITNKNYGMIALKKIPKNTIIIKETPSFQLDSNVEIISDIFQLLYQILTSTKIKQFNNFQPKTTEKFQNYRISLQKELYKLRYTQFHDIYTFFIENYSEDEILLFAAKYMCNAFTPNAILFKGSLLNHACLPNVIFYWKKNQMWFKTVRDIEAGEELCDHYVDITQNKQIRQKRLLEQYGFVCQCIKCT